LFETSTPVMQFMMTQCATPEDAEVVVLLGLHQKLGGPWKLVYLFRQLRCMHIYECVSHGRQWWFTQHLATKTQFSLRELQPTMESREVCICELLFDCVNLVSRACTLIGGPQGQEVSFQ
jgi:hypothetical protein